MTSPRDGIPWQAESLGYAVAVLFVHRPSSSFAIQSSGRLEGLLYGGLPSAVRGRIRLFVPHSLTVLLTGPPGLFLPDRMSPTQYALRGSISFIQEIPKTIGRKKISHPRHLNEFLYDACFPLSSLNRQLRERLLPLAKFQQEAGFFPQIS